MMLIRRAVKLVCLAFGILPIDSVAAQDTQSQVVFIHGLGGSTLDWNLVVNGFGGDNKTVNLLCHADRPCPEDVDIDTMVEDLRLQLSGTSNILVGLSLGAAVSLQFALKYPHLVKKLILVNGAPSFKASNWSFYLKTLARWVAVRLLPMKWTASWIVSKIFATKDEAFLAEAKRRLANNTRAHYTAATNAALDHHVETSELKKLAVDTQILCAEKDRIVTPSMCQSLGVIPNSRIVLIKGAEHAFPMERPDLLFPYLPR